MKVSNGLDPDQDSQRISADVTARKERVKISVT